MLMMMGIMMMVIVMMILMFCAHSAKTCHKGKSKQIDRQLNKNQQHKNKYAPRQRLGSMAECMHAKGKATQEQGWAEVLETCRNKNNT